MGKVRNPGVGRGRGPRSPQRVISRVTVEELRSFLEAMMAPPQALTRQEIADHSGVSVRTVQAVLSGKRPTVNPGTARALLDASYPRRGEQSAWVPTIGSTRRLQALAFYGGWSCPELAEATGVARSTLSRIRNARQPMVRRETAEAIARCYDDLWDRQSTAETMQYVMLYGYRRGWQPPAAWDDDEIDDPAARPKGTLGLRRAG